jgi:uncharacterized membrane protein
MAIVTLILGIVLFGIGITGQTLTRQKKPVAHAGDRKSLNLVVTVASIVIGAWLLILSAVHFLHLHTAGHS